MEENHKINDNEKSKINWVYIYVSIIIYLVSIIVIILMVKLGDNKSLVETIGFGGTMVSIILGFIAIIYPMIQNDNMSNTNMKMINSAEKIKDVTVQLSDLISEVSNDNKYIRDNTDILKDSTDKITDMLLIAKQINTPKNYSISETGKLTVSEMNKILKKLPRYIIYNLYYLYNLACLGRKEDVHIFVDYCKRQDIRLTNFDIIMSTATILYSLDVIEKIVFIKDPNQIGINISEDNKKLIKDFYEEYGREIVSNSKEFELKSIDLYFSNSSV